MLRHISGTAWPGNLFHTAIPMTELSAMTQLSPLRLLPLAAAMLLSMPAGAVFAGHYASVAHQARQYERAVVCFERELGGTCSADHYLQRLSHRLLRAADELQCALDYRADDRLLAVKFDEVYLLHTRLESILFESHDRFARQRLSAWLPVARQFEALACAIEGCAPVCQLARYGRSSYTARVPGRPISAGPRYSADPRGVFPGLPLGPSTIFSTSPSGRPSLSLDLLFSSRGLPAGYADGRGGSGRHHSARPTVPDYGIRSTDPFARPHDLDARRHQTAGGHRHPFEHNSHASRNSGRHQQRAKPDHRDKSDHFARPDRDDVRRSAQTLMDQLRHRIRNR